MNNQPLVSIVIPVYNGSNYLAQAIDSAIHQTYANKEIIVINDGSPDEGRTAEVARRYGDQIRYFEKPNGGVSSALNLGLQQMKGELFSWLSHDDTYAPEKIEVQVSEYLKHPPGTVLFSDFELMDESGVVLYPVRLDLVDTRKMAFHILRDSCFHGCTFMVPAALFREAGIFNESLRHVQDYDMWFRLTRLASFVRVPKVLVQGRQHAAQDSKLKQTAAVRECDTQFAAWIKHYAESAEGKSFERLKEFHQLYLSHQIRGHKKTASLSRRWAIRHGLSGPSMVRIGRHFLRRMGFL